MNAEEKSSEGATRMKEDRTDLEKLLASAESEIVRKRNSSGESASQTRMAAGGSSHR